MVRRASFSFFAIFSRLSPSRAFIIPVLLALLVDGTRCHAQSLSLFADAAPADPADPSTQAVTVGVKFWSTRAGTVSAIRFYRGAKSPTGYVARLYSAAGGLLGSVPMATESGPVPGWQEALFAAPIAIAANTSYVAAYYAPNGQFAASPYGLKQAATNGPLAAPAAASVGGNGVYNYRNRFPTRDYQDTNYFVDVAFISAGIYLSVTANPPNPTIPSTTPLGAVVATLAGTWSDGAPFTGTLSFVAPNFSHGGVFAIDSSNNLIVNPLGPGVGAAAGTTETVTIGATQ
jgi:hypothetical protein